MGDFHEYKYIYDATLVSLGVVRPVETRNNQRIHWLYVLQVASPTLFSGC